MVAKKRDKELQAQFTKWIEEPGRIENIIEGFIRSEELHKLIDDQYHDLVEKYPDKWIAMLDSGVPIVAESSKELYAKLDEQGIDMDDVATKFIRAKGRRMIL